MSRAEIIKHLGDGKYQARLKYAVERVQAELAKINERIAELEVLVPEKKTEVIQKQAEIDSVLHEIDLLIPDYRAGADGSAAEITRLQAKLARISGDLALLRYEKDVLISERLGLLKRRFQLESLPEDKAIELWCADYTTDLSGSVGVVDINDEGGQGVVIQPGYDGQSPWQAVRDGILMARQAQSSAQIYFNAALLPGVQKWRPRYRLAKIMSITNDTCNVMLSDAASSEQQLPINENQTLTDVPIQYMDCNASAFEVNDQVLVRFTQSGPIVVGFYTEPRPCKAGDFAFVPAQYNAADGLESFGLPEIDGNSLGTRNGTNPAWFFRQETSGAWGFNKYREPNYGAQDWQGPNALVLSWRGSPSRAERFFSRALTLNSYFQRDSYVFCNGALVADVSSVSSGALVYGAGIHNGTLTVIAKGGTTWNVIQYPWQGKATTGPGSIVDSFPVEANYVSVTGWYFNETGSEAVMTLNNNREKVAVARYVTGSGIQALNVIWERGFEATGTLTTSGEIVTGTSGVLNETETYTKVTRQHDIPIYVDFIGDVETTLYLRNSERNVTVNNNNATEEYQQADRQQSIAFVLSSGETLATIAEPYNRNWYLNNTAGSPGSMYWEETNLTRFATGDNAFFDIRYKALMVEVEENDYSALYSGTPDGSGIVSGSSTTNTSTVYEMHVAGFKIISLPMQVVNFTNNAGRQYQETPDAIGGEQGPILGPLGPSLTTSGQLVNVGYHEAKGKKLATLFVRYTSTASVDGVEETAFENQITGNVNPEIELFDSFDSMTLYCLGRL